jgi:hypothetical protein
VYGASRLRECMGLCASRVRERVYGAWKEAFVSSIEHTRTEEIRYLIPHSCIKGFMGEF